MAPSLQPPPGGVSLSTTSPSGLLHMCLNAQKQVHCIAYLGRKEMQASKLGNLVGLHSAYLNNLQACYEAGEVPDLIEFLNQPWAELLHFEGFREIRAQLLGLATTGSSGPQILAASMQLLKERALELRTYTIGLGIQSETVGNMKRSSVMV